MEIIHAFGIDLKVLIAQFVNFAIMLFILWKFAYAPMKKFLDDRRSKIESGIKNAEKAEKRLLEISQKEEDILKEAKKEAALILDEAHLQSEENRKQMIDKTKEEIGVIINKEKESIRMEKAETLKEIKREVGALVVMAVETVLAEKIDAKKDKALIEKIIKQIK